MDGSTSGVVFLRGKQVILRPIEERDLESFRRWINDPDIIRGLLRYLPVSEKAEREFFENIQSSTSDIILAIENLEGTLIGDIGLHKIDWRDRTAMTGTVIGDKTQWRKGYAYDAKMTLLNYAFNTLNLRKIYSSVFEFSQRSLKYNLRCGYRVEGRRVKQAFRDGRYWDEVMIAVFQEEWLPLWQEYQQNQDHGTPSELDPKYK